MDFTEYTALQAQIADIALRDVHLGRVLDALLLHVAHASGLDPAQEQFKEDKQALENRRKQEDAQVQAEADARAKIRAVEDEQTLTPDQQTARTLARQDEDVQLQEATDARLEARAEEDKRMEDRAAAFSSSGVPAADVVPPAAPSDVPAQASMNEPAQITTEEGK